MRKVFCASTVEGAVASARRELGEDALLVDVQTRPGGQGSPEGYQVIFESGSDVASLQPSAPRAAIEQPKSDSTYGYHDLKYELTRLSSLVTCLASGGSAGMTRPELVRMAATLQSFDLPADWTHELLNRVEQRLAPGDRDAAIKRILAEELRTSVSFRPTPDICGQKTIMALVGPPGAGKTTTLVKLAMQLGIAAKRSTLVVTTDTYRVAAADQLRTYAAVLGIPFQTVESPRGLSSALAENRQKDLILIDTPGFSPRDWEAAQEWSRIGVTNSDVQVSLVLPATARASDLRQLLHRWAAFRPSNLIFTRMDETEALGGCVGAALDSELPISWLGTGQDIPEDLERASANSLFGTLLGQDARSMAAVA